MAGRAGAASSIRETDEFRRCVRKHTRKNRWLERKLEEAKTVLLENYARGQKVEKDRIPSLYMDRWALTNLFKLDLPQGYRLTYTLQFEGAGMAVILLELLSHDQYEERFGYGSS